MSSYLKIETDDKRKIISIIEDVIEESNLHRISTQKLENGCFCVEIIESQEESDITPASF